MLVKELIETLKGVSSEARVNITVTEGGRTRDFNVLGGADDGDIFDLFVEEV